MTCVHRRPIISHASHASRILNCQMVATNLAPGMVFLKPSLAPQKPSGFNMMDGTRPQVTLLEGATSRYKTGASTVDLPRDMTSQERLQLSQQCTQPFPTITYPTTRNFFTNTHTVLNLVDERACVVTMQCGPMPGARYVPGMIIYMLFEACASRPPRTCQHHAKLPIAYTDSTPIITSVSGPTTTNPARPRQLGQPSY